jgi:hypothetical protein
MFLLMISSIILKLLSAHFLLEHFRKRKIDLFITLLSLLIICGFVINDFAVLNFFLGETVTGPQWFMILLTFFMSISLMVLTIRMRQTKMIKEEGQRNKENDELNTSLKSAALAFGQNPMIVLNNEKKILHMTLSFKTLIGVNSGLTSVFATTLDRLLGRSISIEDILKLDKSIERIVGPSECVCYCKVSTHVCEASHLLVLTFEDYSEQALLMEEQKMYKERINHYQDLLRAGHWTYNFSDNMIQYSKQVQSMLGLKSDRLSYDAFKKIVHPEDLMFINILDNKTLWVGGLHTRYMRIKCGESIKYATIHYQPINDEQGLPVGAKGLIQEISDQRDFIANQFIKEKNDHLSSFITDFDKDLRPLLLSLKNEKEIAYAHEEISRVLELLEYNKKIYNQGKHKNLISADKFIKESVERFSAVCDRFDIELDLKSRHILLAIDEITFKHMLSHLLTEFTQFQYRVPLRIETLGKDKSFHLKCELGVHPMMGEFAYGFKHKLLTPPRGVEDGSLFHAYTLIKRFNGSVKFYVKNNHYGLNISFPAIDMAGQDKKESLERVLYYGNYPILRDITADFFKKFNVHLLDYQKESDSLDDYKVVIFDESISIGEQFLLSKKHPEMLFISFGLPDVLEDSNILAMQQPINMQEIIKILSEGFELNYKNTNQKIETVY